MNRLLPFQRLMMIFPLHEVKHGKVIGIDDQKDGSVNYWIEPLTVSFKSLHRPARVIRINSKDVDNGTVQIQIFKSKKMEDTDLMPFGKYAKPPYGPQKMANVPASYLLWLSENAKAGVRKAFPKVFEYIKENKEVLLNEMEGVK